MTDIAFVDYYLSPGTTIDYIAVISNTQISSYDMSGLIADTLSATIVSTNGGTRNAIRVSGTIPSSTSNGSYPIQFSVTGTDGESDQGAAYIRIGTSNKTVRCDYQPRENPNVYVGQTYDVHFWATKGFGSYDWSILNYTSDDQAIANVSMVENGDEMDLTIEGVSAGSMSIAIRCTADGVQSNLYFSQIIYVSESGDVSSISITGPSEVDSGEEITFTAVSSPSSAANRHVAWTKESGASYFEIETANTSTGGTCTIIADPDQTISRSCSVRATAADGGGATAVKQFTINPVPTIVMPSSLVVGVGETVNVTATFSTTLTWDYAISPTSVATVRVLSSFNGGATFAITGVSDGTATFEIQYQYNGTKKQTCTVNVRGSTPVDPDDPEHVSSIDFQTPNGTEVQVGMNLAISAFAYPTTASDRSLDFTIRSGSQYATISSSSSSAGGSCLITGVSPGTVIIRATARDDDGYYDEITITVIEATTLCTAVYIHSTGVESSANRISELSTNVDKTVDVYPGGYPSYATDTTVTPTFRSGSNIVSIQLITDSVHGAANLSQYRITALTEGTAVIRFTANDGSGEYADLTVTVGEKLNDDYPSDYSKTIFLDMFENPAQQGGNSLGNLLPSSPPYRLHGGYLGVQLPAGLYVLNGSTGDEITTVPAESSSSIVSTSSPFSLQGAATEPGEIWLYVESSSGLVQQTRVVVEAAGSFTKTLTFNPNVPSGFSSTGSAPSTQILENTGGIANFTIPQCDLAVSGHIHIGWRTSTGNSGDGRIYQAGDRFTVTGDDVDAVLYAEWFQIPEGTTGQGTPSDPFTWSFQTYDPVSITVPNKGDYPINTYKYGIGELPNGVTAQIGSTVFSNYPEYSTSFSSGAIVLSGTPTTVSELVFVELGTRGYSVYFRLIVAEGDVPEPGEDLVVTFDANGGTFPNGQEVVTITAPDRAYVLPDWSVVDRPGHRLSHWTDAGGNRSEMGQTKNTIETWTAQWIEDVRGYSAELLPHASVRIYRAMNEYIDATYLQVRGGEVSAIIAENQAGSASFTLLNDYLTDGHGLLSDDCDLWNLGPTGPISTGMYVRIDDINEDGTLSYLLDGFITTISPSAETVDIQIGDRTTFLSKSGTTYRRNFYGESRTSAVFDAGHDGNGLYGNLSTMPPEAIMDGDPFWKVLTTSQNSGSIERSVLGFGNSYGTKCSVRIPLVNVDRLESIRLRLGFRGRNMPETYSFSGVARIRSGDQTWFELWSTSFTNLGTLHTMDLNMDFWNGSTSGVDIVGGEAILELELTGYSGSRDGSVSLLIGGTGPFDIESEVYDITGVSINMDVTTGNWMRVSECELSSDRLTVTAIDGVNDLDDSSLYIPSEDRVRVAFITGSQSTISMMESMAWAFGMTPLVAGTPDDAELRMFRTGGGYALDYYQKLADVPAQSGRRRAFSARGYTTPIIVLSSRHRLTDSAFAHIHYGGDAVTGSEERIALASFSPSMTFKSRPNLVLVRGTMSSKGRADSTPIMVAVEDTASTSRRFGLVVENVIADGSVNMAVDAANSAWAEITENDLDEWEGTITIPGIRRDLLPATGAYAGSGVALKVTDSRNGLFGYQVRARELRIDYSACTTTVVLTNHSMIYSSGISDTAAMAVTSADVATGANDTTLFNTQYVRVRTDQAQTIKDSGNDVQGKLYSIQSWFDFNDVSILQLPSGRNVIVASAPANGGLHARDDASYDVCDIRINGGPSIAIRPTLRPDYYEGQLLILNLDCPML